MTSREITPRRRLGDRSDGMRLRKLPGFDMFIPYIMPRRSGATNYYSEHIEISEADRWLRQQRVDGYKGIGFLHVLVAAYVRVCAQYPAMNRFVAGNRVYAHSDVQIVMAVKKTLELDGAETMIKVHFSPSDTIYDVYRKMNEEIEKTKNSDDSDVENFANAFRILPRPVFHSALGMIRAADYMGWLPESLLEISPFHGSMIITDLGSLGVAPIYHHLYDFGTLPIFVSFGAKRKAYEVNRKGEVIQNKYLDLKISLDERIADGFYMSSALKQFSRLVSDPSAMTEPPEAVVPDPMI